MPYFNVPARLSALSALLPVLIVAPALLHARDALAQPATSYEWVYTGSLSAARQLHTATLLDDGTVLVIGGYNRADKCLSSTEIYDPASGSWRPGPTLNRERHQHTAVHLGGKRVLVIGGLFYDSDADFNIALNNAEICEAGQSTCIVVTDVMSTRRYIHTATRLDDGAVLVTGGGEAPSPVTILETAEIFDAASGAQGTWRNTSNAMGKSRQWHTATALGEGQKVLVSGGSGKESSSFVTLSSTEIYDHRTHTWTPAANMAQTRYLHTSTLLNDGRVLVAGGYCATGGGFRDGAEIYDPLLNTWTPSAQGMPDGGRYHHTATLLDNGRILLTGGSNRSSVFRQTLFFDAAVNNSNGAWEQTASLNDARTQHTATLLQDGATVLVVGGYGANGHLASAELFQPITGPTPPVVTSAPIPVSGLPGLLALALTTGIAAAAMQLRLRKAHRRAR